MSSLTSLQYGGFHTPGTFRINLVYFNDHVNKKKGFEDTNIWIILTSLQCGFKTLISLVY